MAGEDEKNVNVYLKKIDMLAKRCSKSIAKYPQHPNDKEHNQVTSSQQEFLRRVPLTGCTVLL